MKRTVLNKFNGLTIRAHFGQLAIQTLIRELRFMLLFIAGHSIEIVEV
jgi:hypothetical protein